MKKRLSTFWLIAFCIVMLLSCKDNKEDMVVCTMEFRMVSIQVNGPTLDTFYTIRLSTGDTIRPISGRQFQENTYTVLDDNYQPLLVNAEDSFRFYGILQQQQVVNEVFKIKADRCHIDYVSGRTEVTL
jgi:hypothetical protein